MAEGSDRAAERQLSEIAGAGAAAGGIPARTAAAEAETGLGHIGRILIAVLGTWLALLAIPGVMPWNSADSGDRAIVAGAAIMSGLALLSIPISLLWRNGRGAGAAWAGLGTSLLAMGFASLQVVRTLVVPATISKDVVLGVGLLVILAFAFLLVWRRQVVGVPSTTRISTLSLVGSIAALVLIAAYLVVTNTLMSLIQAPAEDWARYSDLRNGLEALAFAAAGALLGTTIQKQSTDRAASRADDNGAAATANYVVAARALDLAEQAAAGAQGVTGEQAIAADRERAAQARELRAQLRLPR